MAAEFHPLLVERAWDTTPRARVAQLRVPEHLREEFVYRAGQYIMVSVEIDGVVEEHAFSLCSSPEAGQPLTIAVKRSGTSRSAPVIQSILQPGASILVRPPKGTFTIDLSPQQRRTFVLFAGGSGISPLLSIATSVLLVEPESTVHLVYANVSAEDTMFAEELRQLKQDHGERLSLSFVLDSGDGEVFRDCGSVHLGRMVAKDIVELVQDLRAGSKAGEFALCGPPGFMEMVQTALSMIAVPAGHIHIESFSSTPRPTPTP